MSVPNGCFRCYATGERLSYDQQNLFFTASQVLKTILRNQPLTSQTYTNQGAGPVHQQYKRQTRRRQNKFPDKRHPLINLKYSGASTISTVRYNDNFKSQKHFTEKQPQYGKPECYIPFQSKITIFHRASIIWRQTSFLFHLLHNFCQIHLSDSLYKEEREAQNEKKTKNL